MFVTMIPPVLRISPRHLRIGKDVNRYLAIRFYLLTLNSVLVKPMRISCKDNIHSLANGDENRIEQRKNNSLLCYLSKCKHFA